MKYIAIKRLNWQTTLGNLPDGRRYSRLVVADEDVGVGLEFAVEDGGYCARAADFRGGAP